MLQHKTADRPYRFNRWSKQGVWEDLFYALSGSSGVISTTAVDFTHIKAPRSAAGAKRGLRACHRSKVHAQTDASGRPIAFTLTAGQALDLAGVGVLLARVPTPRRLIADRADDARKLRDWLAVRDCQAGISPKPTRKHPHAWDRAAYKSRNLIERTFCRLKDFRRVATR